VGVRGARSPVCRPGRPPTSRPEQAVISATAASSTGRGLAVGVHGGGPVARPQLRDGGVFAAGDGSSRGRTRRPPRSRAGSGRGRGTPWCSRLRRRGPGSCARADERRGSGRARRRGYWRSGVASGWQTSTCASRSMSITLAYQVLRRCSPCRPTSRCKSRGRTSHPCI
jgi:hypothetical protein